MMPNTAELIYQEAKTLPDALGAEVLDFIGLAVVAAFVVSLAVCKRRFPRWSWSR